MKTRPDNYLTQHLSTANAQEEIAALRDRERKLRAALRELAGRLPPHQKSTYAQVTIRTGLFEWIGMR